MVNLIEDRRQNTIQTYEQIDTVDNEDVNRADNQHESSSQGSPDEFK